MSTSKHQSIFSRLYSSSASIRSTSSTQPSIPKGCRDTVYARYAKDGKGYDFNLTYPYSANPSSSASSTHSASESEVPVGCRDFKLRYAKDGKGHDFAPTYEYLSANSSTSLGGASDVMPAGCRDFNKNMRYAWHEGRQGA